MMDVEVNVAKGAASLYLASVASLVLNTVYFIVLTNVLPKDTVGLVSLLNILILGVATISTLALPVVGSGVSATPPAVTRFISQYIGEGRGRAARRMLALSLLLSFLIAGAVGLAMASPYVSSSISPSSQGTQSVAYAALDAVIFSLGQVGAYALIGAGRATRAGTVIAIGAVLKYSAASALLILGLGASGVFIGFAIGDTVLLAATAKLSWTSIPQSGEARLEGRALLPYILSILVSGLIGFGAGQTDRLLAFFQRGFTDLAVYNAASVGAAVAAFAPTAITNVLVPILVSSGDGDASRRREVLYNYTRYVCLISLPMGFGLAAVSPALLLLFGEAYLSGSLLLAVMGISVSLTAISSVYSSALLAGKRANEFLVSNALALVALVLVSFLLVPQVGLLGVALGRTTMFLVALVALAAFARRAGDFVLDSGGYAKSFLGSAIMGSIVYLLLTLAEGVIHTRALSIALGVLLIPVGMVVYLFALKLLKAFSERDFEFVERLLPKSLLPILSLVRKLLL